MKALLCCRGLERCGAEVGIDNFDVILFVVSSYNSEGKAFWAFVTFSDVFCVFEHHIYRQHMCDACIVRVTDQDGHVVV